MQSKALIAGMSGLIAFLIGYQLGENNDGSNNFIDEEVVTHNPNRSKGECKDMNIGAPQANVPIVKDTLNLKSSSLRKREREAQKLIERARELEADFDQQAVSEILSLYQEAYGLLGNNEEVLASLANTLIQSTDYGEAVKFAKKCLTVNSRNELCNINLSDAYLFQNKLKEAIEANKNCFANVPQSSTCYVAQAAIAFNQKDHEKVIESYEKVLSGTLRSSIHYDQGFILHQLGVAWGASGDRKSEMVYYKKSCDENYEMACRDLERLNK